MRFLEDGVVTDTYSLTCESEIDIIIEFPDDCYTTDRLGFTTCFVRSRRVATYLFRCLKAHEGFKTHQDQIERWGLLEVRGNKYLTVEDYGVKSVLLSNGDTNRFPEVGFFASTESWGGSETFSPFPFHIINISSAISKALKQKNLDGEDSWYIRSGKTIYRTWKLLKVVEWKQNGWRVFTMNATKIWTALFP